MLFLVNSLPLDATVLTIILLKLPMEFLMVDKNLWLVGMTFFTFYYKGAVGMFGASYSCLPFLQTTNIITN